MSEQETTASGAAVTATESAPATPTGTDYSSMPESEVWDKLEAAQAAPAPTTEGDEDFDQTGPVPEVPEEPAVEPPPEGEEAKPEEAAKDDGEKAEGELPPMKLTEEQKLFLKANPQLKDAVYRDRAFHQLGLNVKMAETLADAGLVTPDNVESAIRAVRSIDALNTDFLEGTPQAATRLLAGLSEEAPAETARFIENLTSPDVLLQASPDAYYKLRGNLLSDVLTNARSKVKEFLDNDPDAVAAIESFESLLDDLSKKAGAVPRPKTAELPPDQKRRLDEVDARERAAHTEFLRGTNQAAHQGVRELVKNELDRLTPSGFHPEVKKDLVSKIAAAVDKKIMEQHFATRKYAEILRDPNVPFEQRRAAAVKHIQEEAKRYVGRVAREIASPYTRAAVLANQKKHEQRRSAANLREVGGTAPARPAPPKIDYRTMSDDQIMAALEQRQRLGR